MSKFTAPKQISPFYNCSRVPRKKKKKYKILLNKYPFLQLNQKLWLILGSENPDYKSFLIQKICEQEN